MRWMHSRTISLENWKYSKTFPHRLSKFFFFRLLIKFFTLHHELFHWTTFLHHLIEFKQIANIILSLLPYRTLKGRIWLTILQKICSLHFSVIILKCTISIADWVFVWSKCGTCSKIFFKKPFAKPMSSTIYISNKKRIYGKKFPSNLLQKRT